MYTINLDKYDLVLSTALDARHGLCGHTFELIEYWLYFRMHGLSVAILTTSVSPDILLAVVRERYNLTSDEIATLEDHLYDGTHIKVAKLPTTLWVDGSTKFNRNLVAVSKRNIAFLCNNTETLNEMDLVLMDTRIYDTDIAHKTAHYVKKIMFSRLKKPKQCLSNTAMLYCTTQARRISADYLSSLNRFDFSKYILVSNDTELQSNARFEVLRPPVHDLFSKFNTYIYSPLKIGWAGAIDVLDCSPRFPAECTYFGKDIIIDAPMNRGLAIRMHDCQTLERIELTKDDHLVNLI